MYMHNMVASVLIEFTEPLCVRIIEAQQSSKIQKYNAYILEFPCLRLQKSKSNPRLTISEELMKTSYLDFKGKAFVDQKEIKPIWN